VVIGSYGGTLVLGPYGGTLMLHYYLENSSW
jgi:hypothetical protein